jgi:hypothetical protein
MSFHHSTIATIVGKSLIPFGYKERKFDQYYYSDDDYEDRPYRTSYDNLNDYLYCSHGKCSCGKCTLWGCIVCHEHEEDTDSDNESDDYSSPYYWQPPDMNKLYIKRIREDIARRGLKKYVKPEKCAKCTASVVCEKCKPVETKPIQENKSDEYLSVGQSKIKINNGGCTLPNCNHAYHHASAQNVLNDPFPMQQYNIHNDYTNSQTQNNPAYKIKKVYSTLLGKEHYVALKRKQLRKHMKKTIRESLKEYEPDSIGYTSFELSVIMYMFKLVNKHAEVPKHVPFCERKTYVHHKDNDFERNLNQYNVSMWTPPSYGAPISHHVLPSQVLKRVIELVETKLGYKCSNCVKYIDMKKFNKFCLETFEKKHSDDLNMTRNLKPAFMLKIMVEYLTLHLDRELMFRDPYTYQNRYKKHILLTLLAELCAKEIRYYTYSKNPIIRKLTGNNLRSTKTMNLIDIGSVYSDYSSDEDVSGDESGCESEEEKSPEPNKQTKITKIVNRHPTVCVGTPTAREPIRNLDEKSKTEIEKLRIIKQAERNDEWQIV